MRQENRTIIGVDPGTLALGYGIIHVEKNERNPKIIQSGTLKLDQYKNLNERLERIWERLNGILATSKPDLMVFESAFYGKNIQVMLKLGRVQGLLLGLAFHHKLTVREYSPREIKQALTGNGNASKPQVAAMVSEILNLPPDQDRLFDTTDALSIALCGFYKKDSKGSKKQSWSSFVKQNPSKIK